MKKTIYFNQIFNESNPPSNATCLTYDKDNGLQLVDNKEHVSFTATIDTNQNSKINNLEDKVSSLEKSISSHDEKLSNINISNDYTAFEIFAHDYIIPTGYCEELKGNVSIELPACLTQHFVVRTVEGKVDNDVVVDWGDGESTKLADLPDELITGERHHFIHEYKETGKYIVKIFGKKYFNFMSASVYTSDNANKLFPNSTQLMCRVFDYDLPIASHIYNYVAMCHGCDHLINVNVFNSNFKFNAVHCDNLFASCDNLLQVTGFVGYCNNSEHIATMFGASKNLKYTDFQFATLTSPGIYTTFSNCNNLEIDISTLFPKNWKPGSPFNVGYAFQNCKKLYGTVPADLLWNNKDVKWTTTAKCFYGCSSEIRAQVPKSWGGTADNSIIKTSVDETISLLEERIKVLEEKLASINVSDN